MTATPGELRDRGQAARRTFCSSLRRATDRAATRPGLTRRFGDRRPSLGHLNSCHMRALQVSDAIQCAAGLCSELAARLDIAASPVSGPPSQPSAAAVAAGHAHVEAAAAALTVRLQATGAKLFEAKLSYDEHDARSAATLGGQVV